jgi:hypothetical protein
MNEQGETATCLPTLLSGVLTATCLPTLLSGVLTSSLLKYFTLKLKTAGTHETLAIYISTKKNTRPCILEDTDHFLNME